LREAIRAEKARRPFQIDAMVILPNHFHALWTLPPDDDDYSIRWRNIKRSFTQQIESAKRPYVLGSPEAPATLSNKRAWKRSAIASLAARSSGVGGTP